MQVVARQQVAQCYTPRSLFRRRGPRCRALRPAAMRSKVAVVAVDSGGQRRGRRLQRSPVRDGDVQEDHVPASGRGALCARRARGLSAAAFSKLEGRDDAMIVR